MRGPSNESTGWTSRNVWGYTVTESVHASPRLLFGVPIDALTMDEVLSIADDTISHDRQLLICVVNAAKLVYMRQDEALRDAVLSAHLVLADGMSVVWAARLLGCRIPERVAGIDLMFSLLENGNERGYRIFCLGATEEVMGAVRRRIETDYPKVELVGCRHGYYAPEEETEIAAEIAAAEPDILFVGMSMPKKELFLSRWASEMKVPVCHGVGGAFDILAGKVKRAPGAVQRFGMEWSYRFIQEPRRMWRRYLVTNFIFCCMVVSEFVSSFRSVRS